MTSAAVGPVLRDGENKLFSYLAAALFSVSLWCLFAFLRLPASNADDLFFTGAAIHLAATGEYANPLLAKWNAALHCGGKFFFQPPFHAYTLAAWIKAFGVGERSFLWFHAAVGMIGSLAFILFLRHYQAPRWTAWATPVIILLGVLPRGFRPDLLAFAYLALGLWFLSVNRPLTLALGGFFLSASACTLAVFACYALGLGGSVLFSHWRKAGRWPFHSRAWPLAFVLLGIGAAFLVFLAMIDWELPTFVRGFLLTASWRKPDNAAAGFRWFVKLITEYWGAIVFVPSYLIFFFSFTHQIVYGKQAGLRSLTAGCGISFILAASIYPPGAYVTMPILGWIITLWQATATSSKVGAIILNVLLSPVYLISQTLTLAAMLGTEQGDSSALWSLRRKLESDPSRTLVVDSFAARAVFDFRLPPGALDWDFCVPGEQAATLAMRAPSEAWVVSVADLVHFVKDAPYTADPVQVFGRKFSSLPRRPYDIVVVDGASQP